MAADISRDVKPLCWAKLSTEYNLHFSFTSLVKPLISDTYTFSNKITSAAKVKSLPVECSKIHFISPSTNMNITNWIYIAVGHVQGNLLPGLQKQLLSFPMIWHYSNWSYIVCNIRNGWVSINSLELQKDAAFQGSLEAVAREIVSEFLTTRMPLP